MNWFKSLRLSTQLLSAFIVVALIAAAVGIRKSRASQAMTPTAQTASTMRGRRIADPPRT